MKNSYFQTFLSTCALIGVVGVVRAQPQHDDRRDDHHDQPAAHRVEEHHINQLPKDRVEVRVGNDHYFERRGTFYRQGPQGYVVVRPPRGAHIPHLPPHAARVYIGGNFFWRWDNVYYQQVGEDYVVVDPPGVVTASPDAVVAAGPAPTSDYQSINVGSAQYFFRDGQFFQNTSEGMVWAPAPIGAITPTLPGDAQSVWYQEIEYFDCDGVYFRKTPDGYKVVNAPWVKN
jgi:hypothetical protein